MEDERRQIATAAATLDSIRTAPVTNVGAVALGYLARLRLGVAAPFRLVEQAAADPRLPATIRERVAWALVDRIHRGDAFRIDSTALGDGPGTPPTVIADGGWHRAFIDSLVDAAPSPRTGEETVRLTYALARAEWLVTPQTATAAVDAAALARDRRLAQTDADRLLAAPLTEVDSTRLLLARSWRIARLFSSERPLLADDLAPDHTRAVHDAERALTVMRAVALASPNPPDSTAHPFAGSGAPAAVFPLLAAARLSDLPSVRTGFPSAPIVVTLGGFRHQTATTAAASTLDTLRARFLARARTDESLAAEWTLLRAALPSGDPEGQRLARVVLAAAVATRASAQDAPAVTGPTLASDDAAAITSLKWRDGVREFRTDPGLPPTWGPQTATCLSTATANLHSVFPTFALDGLTVRIGDSPKRDLALALHDPARRTVYLPPLTAAGTVAHELAHDLDWQTARTQLGVRGIYATDRAVRPPALVPRNPRDTGAVRALATAVRTMTGVHTTLPASQGALGAPPPGQPAGEGDRPAELFARGVDFFVAAALAREGRSDGTLTAVQDRLLVGYAGVRAPDPGDGTAESLVDVLDGMTLVPAAARQWYLARFGRMGTRTPLAIVDDVLRAPPAWGAERALRDAGVPGGLAALDAPALRKECDTGPGGGAPAPWQARLVWLTADARARGYVRARALRAVESGGSWWGWTARPILGGPWLTQPADAAVDRLRDALLRAAAADRERRLPFANAAGTCPW